MIIPRWYQNDTSDALFNYLMNSEEGNPVAALPTGTGKSIIVAMIIKRFLAMFPHMRFIMATHTEDLVSQNFEELMSLWPTAPAGIYCAGLGRKETHARIIFGTIQSLRRVTKKLGFRHIVIIDECHMVPAKSTTIYQKFLAELRDTNPLMRVIGLSATPYRLGQGMITDNGIFTDICIDLTSRDAFNRFIKEYYLAPLSTKETELEFDVEHIRTMAGDFNQKELQSTIAKEQLTRNAIAESAPHIERRNYTMVFCAGNEHARLVGDIATEYGWSNIVVTHDMKEKRRDVVARIKNGMYKIIINNNILTTGFNFKPVDLILMLRPTKSVSLWVQMLGRGTRPVYAPGFDLSTLEGRKAAMEAGSKQNCLVLDFSGNRKRLGPINDPYIKKKKKSSGGGGGSAPFRVCSYDQETQEPGCGEINPVQARYCEGCGKEFPVIVKLETSAETEEMISTGELPNKKEEEPPEYVDYRVDSVDYDIHTKKDGSQSLRVTYHCGILDFSQWFKFQGRGRKLAWDWWRKGADDYETQPPTNIVLALNSVDLLRPPTFLTVYANKKPYPEIVKVHYDEIHDGSRGEYRQDLAKIENSNGACA